MSLSNARTFEVDGLRLHVTSYGGPTGAPPALLVHGGMAHGGWWRPLAKHLRSDFRVFALDRRGHGQSEWAPLDRYGWRYDLDDAERVCAQLDPGPWLVAGHSQGGLLSVHLALRDRLPTFALILLDAPLHPRASALVQAGKSLRRIPQVRYPSLAHAIRRFQPYPKPHYVRDDVLQTIARESFASHPDGSVTSRFDWKRFRAEEDEPHPLHSFADDVGRVTTPTLVLRGAHSTILSAEDHNAFVARLPNGRGVEIAEATHSLHVEHPEVVASEMRRFAKNL